MKNENMLLLAALVVGGYAIWKYGMPTMPMAAAAAPANPAGNGANGVVMPPPTSPIPPMLNSADNLVNGYTPAAPSKAVVTSADDLVKNLSGVL